MQALDKFYKAKAHRGQFGVEVEVEFLNNAIYNVEFFNAWKIVPDHSLRHVGLEFTSGSPWSYLKTLESLQILCEYISRQAHVAVSPRTSVHVHVNMLKFSPIQIWTAACAYWMLEPLLFKVCGPTRQNNLFCLRLIDAEHLLDACIADITNNDYPFKYFNDFNDIRYAGLNMSALRKFGSIEFRGMRGIYRYNKLKLWLSICQRVAHASPAIYETPERLLDTYYYRGPKYIAQAILGDEIANRLLAIPHATDLIAEGANAVFPLAYCTEWPLYEQRLSPLADNLELPDIGKNFLVPPRLNREQARAWDAMRIIEEAVQNQPINNPQWQDVANQRNR